MIRSPEDLLKKLREDERRCISALEEKLKIIQEKKNSQSQRKEAEREYDWLAGYLFCLMEEGCISIEEMANLRKILLDMVYD